MALSILADGVQVVRYGPHIGVILVEVLSNVVRTSQDVPVVLIGTMQLSVISLFIEMYFNWFNAFKEHDGSY